MMNTKYPKGGMCVSCQYRFKDCTKLDFKSMRPAKRYDDGTTSVICDKYARYTK